MSETSAVVTPLIDALLSVGIYADRYNAGRVPTRNGWVHLHRAGTLDVGGELHGGRAFYVECKIAKGKLRETQVEWAAAAKRRGCIVLQCHDPAGIPAVVAELLRIQGEALCG